MNFVYPRSLVAALALGVAGVVLPLGGLGCIAAPRLSMQAERYRIEATITPSSSELIGRTVLDLTRRDSAGSSVDGPCAVELLLHPDLKITRVECAGASCSYRGTIANPPENEGDFAPSKHVIVLNEAVESLTIFIDYEGRLFQDVSAGETAGRIHNFTMRAHIGPEGVYLANGYWYPEPASEDDQGAGLADYVLLIDPVDDLELVAGGVADPRLADQTGWLAWRSPYPVDGMVVVGGAHEVHRATHNGVDLAVHLKPDQARHAEGLLDTLRRNLDRYEPLIGPYPASEFAIVDNFFSSGFAYPTFTLLSSAVINMGERSQTGHGYIDHELLHCWWGNGVHVDRDDGNWCEALASYGANYYGYVLDGNQEDARRKRRNYSHFLSRIKPERDKPLGTYGQEDGCGRGIAYNKGAMVFHMLARRIGQDKFWEAMRKMTKDYVGTYASWEDIRRLCEEAGGTSLERFIEQWVRSGGAPQLALEEARYSSDDQKLILTLSQGEPAFELDVPIRIMHADGTLDIKVRLSESNQDVIVPIDVIPLSAELDPDYHLFRKMPLDRIIPTTASTRYGTAFASVLPAGESPGTYATLKTIFAGSFEEDERIALTAGEIEEGVLAKRCVLIMGKAVHDPYVSAFLSAVEFPVRFTDDGFELHDIAYTDPGDAVLCTILHPDVKGGGVTVVYANSENAIPRPWYIPMYDRSLVIFKDQSPVLKHDFERQHVLPVTR